jgi:hypothetical protein
MGTEARQSNARPAWNCLEETERAVAAVHGISCILMAHDRPGLLGVIRAVQETLDMIRQEARALHGDELRRYCASRTEELKAWSVDLLANVADKSPLLSLSDPDRVFIMFRDSWSTTTAQLRASASDISECFNSPVLGAALNMSPVELSCLPPSSEFVLGLCPDGLRCDLEIPARTFFLDAALQLDLARECHDRLTQWAMSKDEAEPLRERTKLDAFIRQALVAGVTAVEAALTDYSHYVVHAAARQNPQADMSSATRGGVTTRLRNFTTTWPLAFGREPQAAPEPVTDMVKLIQVRNRLVHHDGRVSAWHAMQLDLAWIATEYQLSSRADSYKSTATYGLSDSHVGMEFAFGVFALNTVLATLDALHTTVYPGQAKAAWLRISRTAAGSLDFPSAQPKRSIAVER